MTRLLSSVVLSLLLMACNRAPQNEAAVREALREHLSKNAGLDLSSLDMEITNLTFEGNTARANVAFKPKAAPGEGMQMSYTLESDGNKWTVKGKGAGHGGAMGEAQPQAPAGGDLPAGHPPVSGSDAAAGKLPAGHPPVPSEKPAAPTEKK